MRDFCLSFATELGIETNRYQLIRVFPDIQLKYDGYIDREQEVANKMQRLENVNIPKGIVYSEMPSLSTEATQKLTNIKPATIGQASRISGVSPSDISILLIFLGR